MTQLDKVMIDIDNSYNLPLKENENLYHNTKWPKKKAKSNRINQHSNNRNKKHLRETEEENCFSPELNLSLPIKKKAMTKSIVNMFDRITLTDKEGNLNARKIKIFSDGIILSSSSLLKNLYKNYYPCMISEYYSSQVRHSIIANQLNKAVGNLNSHRKKVMDKRRTTSSSVPIGHCGRSSIRSEPISQLNLNNKWVIVKNNRQEYYNESEDDDNDEKDEDFDDEDSNAENNPNTTYPSIEISNDESNDNQNDDYEDEVQDEDYSSKEENDQ